MTVAATAQPATRLQTYAQLCAKLCTATGVDLNPACTEVYLMVPVTSEDFRHYCSLQMSCTCVADTTIACTVTSLQASRPMLRDVDASRHAAMEANLMRKGCLVMHMHVDMNSKALLYP